MISPIRKICKGLQLDRPKPRWSAYFFAAILVFGWAPSSVGLERNDFYFASLGNTYTAIHAKESRIAMQAILQKIFAPTHPDMRLSLDFLAKDADLKVALTSKPYDVIASTGLDFLQLRKRFHLRPLAILSKTDQPTDTYVLVTRKDKTLEALEQLPDRRLIVEAGGSGEIACLWLDAVLKSRGLPPHQIFFNSQRTGDKPSRILLPVFFGQADACVVPESAFAVINELNPQMEEKLVILERSAGYISILISATDRLEDWARNMVLAETERMHTYPEGRQILTIMQMKRFFKFKPEYLEATETLYQGRLEQTVGGK
jgi:ABC-type phosphate/phosphonate transport system substrate-binding protein